jgi:hypothetical protein
MHKDVCQDKIRKNKVSWGPKFQVSSHWVSSYDLKQSVWLACTCNLFFFNIIFLIITNLIFNFNDIKCNWS